MLFTSFLPPCSSRHRRNACLFVIASPMDIDPSLVPAPLNLPAKNQQTSSFQNQQPQNQQSQTTQPQTQKLTTQIQPVSYQPVPRKPVPVSYQPIPVTNQTGPTIPTPQPPSQPLPKIPTPPPVQPPSSTQSPPPKRRKLTALAEKYGQPPLTPLFGTDPIKSGLTPLINGPFATAAERALFERCMKTKPHPP